MPLRSTAMGARGTIGVCVRAGALALLAASGGGCKSTVGPFHGETPVLAPCTQSEPPMPAAHLGPDANIRVVCGASGAAAVASVDERGAGTTIWSASVLGVPPGAFSLEQTSFQTCQARGPTVATVAFHPPSNALPGDKFEGVVTIRSTDGAFDGGTVNVHAEIILPAVSVDKPTIDFGDVHAGVAAKTQRLTITTPDLMGASVQRAADLDSTPDPNTRSPFAVAMIPTARLQPNTTFWDFDFYSSVPGDFSATVGFSTSFFGSTTCEWKATINLHARVLPDGTFADGGADGAEGDAQ